MSKSYRIRSSIFGIAPRPDSHPFRCHLQTGSRCTEKNRSKSLDLTTHLPWRLSTMNWTGAVNLMEPTQRPNEKYDRNRYADQPKQKKSTHDILLIYLTSHSNKISELKFRRLVVYGCRPIMFDNPSAVIWFRTIC
jgi:hypothetical protein